MKTYVISLERAKERRDQMIRQCEASQMDYEVIDGMDGTLLDEARKQEMVVARYLDCSRWCYKNGEIGCAYSHMACYEKMIEDDVPYALILEDDALLPENIGTILSQVEPYIDEGVILLSFYSHIGDSLKLSSQKSITMASIHAKLMYPADHLAVGSGMAYIITQDAAKKIIRKNKPMVATADSWGKFRDLGCFESIRCLYPGVFGTAEFSSTIDYGTQGSLLFKAVQFIRRYRIPFLFQCLKVRDKRKLDKKLSVGVTDEKPYMDRRS